jgi:putative radical SAM enzyme (TIGR03279 family)
MGGVIFAVDPSGLAGRIGLQPGDEVLSVNDHPLRDIVDVRFYSAEERLVLRVHRDGREFTVEAERRYDEPLGLEFADPTFDGVRHCDNRCEFCFVAQMPPGLRRSLYVRDDDYRYSFLFGNYVTLTNLSEADWARIGEQHLSPLYVSVHATDAGLRRRVLGNPTIPDVMAQLRRLADLGIDVHAQIVVMPGLNDGPHLDRSIGDLAGLYPSVCSVSVVPVGLTRFHRGGCRVHTDAEMRLVFEQVTGWQARLRERLGVSFAYLSDEWYLRLGEEVPPAGAYDGLDLTENGVGLVRQFLSSKFQVSGSWVGTLNLEPATLKPETLTLVTGTLFAPVLRSVVAALSNEVVPVVNRFFGETVTVAGLLTGQDVVAQLRGRDLGDVVVLPPAMFDGPGGQSLDEMRPEEIEEALGRRVVADDFGEGNTGAWSVMCE